MIFRESQVEKKRDLKAREEMVRKRWSHCVEAERNRNRHEGGGEGEGERDIDRERERKGVRERDNSEGRCWQSEGERE